MPAPPRNLLVTLFILALLIIVVQLQLLSVVFLKLGLPAEGAYLVLTGALFGSVVNLPLFQVATPPDAPVKVETHNPFLHLPIQRFRSHTVIAVNVGGCLVPLVLVGYLLGGGNIGASETLLGTLFVAGISYVTSRPIRGLGIGMPILVAPIAAAMVAVLLDPQNAPPLAYVSGTLGVLIGADLLRLKDIRKIGVPFAAIGGAGVMDGVFISGVVAALLA